jgi:peptidyl-prolyl cis-trans isomerase C
MRTGKIWRVRFRCLVFISLITAVSAGVSAADTESDKKNAVARVNGDFITREAYQRQFNFAQQQLLSQGVPLDDASLKRLRNEVLENLIDNELLFEEGNRRGYAADEGEINSQFDEVQAQFPTEQEFQAALKEMNYTAATFKYAVERRITLEKLIENDIAPGITVSDEESHLYYEDNPEYFVQPKQVRASHILIMVEDQNNEQQKQEALEKIKLVQQKLREGGDFAALAMEYSGGPSSAQGGDLGFFQSGQMVPPFEEAAFSMKVGEVSDVVETRFGYHLIKVTDIQAEVSIPYEHAKNSIVQYLTQNLIMNEIEVLVTVLKDEAEIERYPENM